MTLVSPAPISRLRRFLLERKADMWGFNPLFRFIVGEPDPQTELLVKIARNVTREPNKWEANAYGLTNFEDNIGIYTAEGLERVAIAVDSDKQIYPTAYWRWFFFTLSRIHADCRRALQSDAIGSRL